MVNKKVKIKDPNEYRRPHLPINYFNTLRNVAVDCADVIQKHLSKRLNEEERWLRKLYVQQAEGETGFIKWFNETEQRCPTLITKEVAVLNKKKGTIDFYSDEGKALIGERLLAKFIIRKREEVIELRKALGLERITVSNDIIILTNGIERSDLFRLFGSPLTIEALKKSYRKLASECHPDAGGSDELMSQVSKLYKRITEMWDIYDPANLAIPEDKLQGAMNKKFSDPLLIALLEK